MRFAALFVALLTIVIGIGGLISPDRLMAIRRQYYATPATFYVAGAVRGIMGLVLILAATASRSPKIVRVLGALMCLQAMTATLLGFDHARTVMEWETMQGAALLRVGAAVALASGGFIGFALAGGKAKGRGQRAEG